ncbi:MAG: FAD binding domain-containing protein [Gammaproteobacteria bacterium]|nr:FAD binding domain-containing protein [Gammaproteobacteria bacterium]
MRYVEPVTLAEALELLGTSEDARCLAGGATLVAMMNADLVEPELLVGLRRLEELVGIDASADGVRIGAMTTHAAIAADARLTGAAAAVRSAAGQIAHPAIRNQGTIGGAICHADPAADFPAALVAADAVVEVRGADAVRSIPAAEFFVDYLTTALAPGEMVIAVRVPAGPARAIGRHLKFSRTEGDYATVSVAVVIAMHADVCGYARVALGSAGPAPVHVDAADATLAGSRLDAVAIERAGALLVDAADPVDDVRGSADYRRLLIPRLLGRALDLAREDNHG